MVNIADKFAQGESVVLDKLPVSSWKVGALVALDEAKYFGGPCQVAGRFREWAVVGDQHRVRIQVTRTTHEDLLKYITGTTLRQAEVHLCGAQCSGEPHDQGLLHCRKGRLIKMEKEGECTWEKNLAEDVDDLARLREAQKDTEKDAREMEALKKKEKSSSSSSRGKKDEKKKKEKMKKKKKKQKKEAVDTKENVDDKRTSKRSFGGRSVARKDLSLVFSGTGLDPRPHIRRRVLKYAKKKVAKKKDSASSSSGSLSTGSDEVSSEEGHDVLMDASKIKMMSRHAPGGLTMMGALRMQESLAEQEGVWQLQENVKSLPACTLRYVRASLGSRLLGGALKEAITLASSLDLVLQGRVAESADMMIQRLKSMERVSQGSSWTSAERMELAPALNPQISTRAEVEAANREAKLDMKAKGGAPATYPTKGTYGKGKKGKTEEKGQGKGKRKDDAKANKNTSS